MTWRYDLADVAHYQNEPTPIDWVTYAAGSPGSGGVTKLTQRNNYVDPTAARSRAEMARVGLRRRGVYHWQSPVAEASIADQFAHFQRSAGTLAIGEFFMLDAEQYGITEPESYDTLCRAEEWIGRPAAHYGGVGTAGGKSWVSDRIRTSIFGTPRFMWLAAYLTQEQLAAKLAQLHLTGFVAHANQYASSGPVPGVIGRCDMNQINDFGLLDVCCGYTQSHEENDMITVNDIFKDADSPGDKYALMSAGYFRPVSGTELTLVGITDSLELGKPVTKAQRDELAALIPAAGGKQVPFNLQLQGLTNLSGTATPIS